MNVCFAYFLYFCLLFNESCMTCKIIEKCTTRHVLDQQFQFQSQIVELYKDPDGKNITTFKSNTEKDNATVDKSTSGSEMKDLRRKVVELETSLKQYVRA